MGGGASRSSGFMRLGLARAAALELLGQAVILAGHDAIAADAYVERIGHVGAFLLAEYLIFLAAVDVARFGGAGVGGLPGHLAVIGFHYLGLHRRCRDRAPRRTSQEWDYQFLYPRDGKRDA